MITTGSVSEEEGTTKAAPSTVQQMDIINVDADKARPGDLVEFQGLQSAAYLNGTKGYLVEFINNEQQWAVLRFQGGKSVKAKPQNLKLLSQTTVAASSSSSGRVSETRASFAPKCAPKEGRPAPVYRHQLAVSTSSLPDADAKVTHQALTCMSRGELRELCESKNLPKNGNRENLIDRFLKAQLRGFPTKKKPTPAAMRQRKSRANQSEEKSSKSGIQMQCGTINS